MQTVSLDTAKRLKELGLEWEPKKGDWYFHSMVGIRVNVYNDFPFDGEAGKNCLWLPRLDQIMEEIERQEGVRDIIFHPRLNPDSPRECTIEYLDGVIFDFGPNDTEACGLALVQIMERVA